MTINRNFKIRNFINNKLLFSREEFSSWYSVINEDEEQINEDEEQFFGYYYYRKKHILTYSFCTFLFGKLKDE